MKKFLYISILSLACLLYYGLSFSKKGGTLANKQSVLYTAINKWYTTSADSFLQALSTLQKMDNAKVSHELILKQFIKVRRAFKKMEVLISHFDPNIYIALNTHINPEVELEKGTYEYEQEPHGLQVIETLVGLYQDAYDRKDDSLFDATRLLMAKELTMAVSTARFLKTYHFFRKFSDSAFFNAVQEQLLRIAALGTSGFDKPYLTDAIPECSTALSGIQELVEMYQNKYPSLLNLKKISSNIISAKQYISLNYKNFSSFNRLTFIREQLQPILTIAGMLRNYFGGIREASTIVTSFFQKSYIDQAFHETKTYSAEMIALGNALFESPILSANGRLTCSSCHNPKLDFADTLQRNLGFSLNDTVARNTPTLLNIKYHIRFQRDGHDLFMQDQFREVLSNHIEMGNTTEAGLERRVREDPALVMMFKTAFHLPKDSITYQHALDALEAFVRSLTSLHSEFDKYMTRQTNTISPAVKRGFNLFMGAGKCGTCHFLPIFNGTVPPLYTNEENEVIGVLKNDNFEYPVVDSDEGLYAITKQDIHKHSFKVPTVRNLNKTAPYMHNGSLKTLDAVLDFYNLGGGGGWSMGAEVPNQTLSREHLKLDKDQRDDIKAFLLSLGR